MQYENKDFYFFFQQNKIWFSKAFFQKVCLIIRVDFYSGQYGNFKVQSEFLCLKIVSFNVCQ